jgi:hypothetical protein
MQVDIETNARERACHQHGQRGVCQFGWPFVAAWQTSREL